MELCNFFNSSISFETYDELHVIPIFAAITVIDEVVDLVVEVLLLERNEVLPAEIQKIAFNFRTLLS